MSPVRVNMLPVVTKYGLQQPYEFEQQTIEII